MFPVIETSMKEFVASCTVRFCPMCGVQIPNDRKHSKIGRPRTFCSDRCRRKYWKAHPKREQWDSFEKLICPVCGRMFFAQRENRRKRKYCSRACANRGRALKGVFYEDSSS